MPAEADAMQSRDMFEEPLINDVKDEDVDAEFGGREISDRGDTAPLGVGINMVKCAVGAGSFSFPYAFTQTGILGGVIGICAFALIAGFTMAILARAEKLFLVKKSRERGCGMIPRMTWPELVRAAFPGAMIRGNNVMVGLLYCTVVFTSIGIAVAYILFIASTLDQAFGWDTGLVIIGLTLPALGLALLQSFKYLAFTSVLGDIAVVSGLVGTIWGGLAASRHMSWPSNVPAFNTAHPGNIPIGLATLSFMFNIQMMCLPMVQSLKRDIRGGPKMFDKIVGVSFSFILGLNLLFTLICVAVFHDDEGGIKNPVIRNLNTGAVLNTIRVLLCVDLLFTLPMVLSVGREVIEMSLLYALGIREEAASKPRGLSAGTTRFGPEPRDALAPEPRAVASGKSSFLLRLCVRGVLVAFILLFSAGAIKNSGVNQAFGDVVALIGGVSGALLGLILPPLIYLRASDGEVSTTTKTLLWSTVVLGVALLVSTSYYTCLSIAHPDSSS